MYDTAIRSYKFHLKENKLSKQVEKELVQGTVLGKYPCPSCLSNDNLVVYIKHDNEGKAYLDASCFTPSCDNKYMTEDMLKEQGVLDENTVIPKVKPVTKTAITKAEYKALTARTSHDTTQPDGSLYRSIKPETAAFYGHLYARDSEGNIVEEYYPETKEGFNGDLKSLRGYKKRVLPKDFGKGNIGITGLSNDFSGQHLFRSGGKYVVITGGEIDKLSVAQMLRDYQISRGQDDYDRTAVVSCTAGEGSLAKQCAANYEWLDLFDNIILCGDSDEVGKAAVIEAASKLPEDKVKIVTLSMKDANEMLVAGKHKQFISNYFDAKPLTPDEVKTSKQADGEIEEELGRPKVPLPPFMHSLQRAMAGGIPLGYMVNLGAVTGGGKTTIINEMVYYWIFNSPVKIGILSLELTAGQYQTALLSRHIGFKINLIEDPKEAVAFVQQDWVQEKRKELRENEYGEERYVLLDERSGSLEAVKKQILKLIKKYSTKMIVIDPINDLFEGSNLEAQTDFIKFLKQIIKDGISIFNVCHVTKGKTQVDKEGNVMMRQLTEDDFSGVTNLIKSGGCNIVAMRNKSETDEVKKNTTEVDILKCRWTGYTGFVGSWYYDPISHTLYDKQDFMEQQRSNF